MYEGRAKRVLILPDGTRKHPGKMPDKAPGHTTVYRPSTDQDRIATVKRIFQMFADGTSPEQIAAILNEKGVSEGHFKHNKVKIRAMLSNPIYRGYPGACDEQQFEPIIDDRTWQRVQERLEKGATGQFRAPRTASLYLKPLLRCYRCKQPMRATSQKQGYMCGTYATYGRENETNCRYHFIAHSEVEAAIEKYLGEASTKLPPPEKPGVKVHFSQDGESGFSIRVEDSSGLLFLQNEATGLWEAMCKVEDLYEDEHGTRKEYGEIYAERLPALQRQLNEKEAQLETALTAFASLAHASKSAQKALDSLQTEVKAIREQTTDLRTERQEKLDLIEQRRREHKEALEAYRADEYTVKFEAASRVIDGIEIEYKPKGKVSSEPVKIHIHAKDGSHSTMEIKRDEK